LVIFIGDKVDDAAGVGILHERIIDVREGGEENVGILVVGDGFPPTG
jgi:hypothetical protein